MIAIRSSIFLMSFGGFLVWKFLVVVYSSNSIVLFSHCGDLIGVPSEDVAVE